jgi:hypothetical protein
MEIATITGHSISDVHSIVDKFYFNRDPAIEKSGIEKLLQTVLQIGLRLLEQVIAK